MSSRAKRAQRLAKLRSCIFDGKPWCIMPQAMTSVVEAIDGESMSDVRAALSYGFGEVESQTQVVNGIAIIPVSGVLRDEIDFMVRIGFATSYQVVEAEIQKALGNDQVTGILLHMDTPGGSAIGCKRVADSIFAARGKKPIHAFTQTICGSAGYYMMAACSHASATADAMVGSIGTIYTHQEYSKALADFGIGATVFTNEGSPKKGHGNQFQKLSDESKKTLQAFTDSYGAGFIADVARYRNLTPADVAENYGSGDAFRADAAISRGMIDAVVANLNETLDAMSSASTPAPVARANSESPVLTGENLGSHEMNKRILAQLFAMGLIDSMEVTEAVAMAAYNAWFAARGVDAPKVSDEAEALAGLQAASQPQAKPEPAVAPAAAEPTTPPQAAAPVTAPAENVAAAHEAEMGEARLADLSAAAALVNATAGSERITAAMVLDAFSNGLDAKGAMTDWNKTLSEAEPTAATTRTNVTDNSDSFAQDAVDAMVFRSSDNPSMDLSAGAANLTNRPLWAVACQALQLAGESVDMYGDRELIAEQAMSMGDATRRATFFSANEDRRYLQNAGAIPNARPGDFPNILSSLTNKFLDTIQLDEDYSYPAVSALLPGGLNDFKPALMINKGIVEEMDEVQDAEQFQELGLEEEVLSYIFLRRFGNKFGWSPVMVANDDLNAFAEGMIGLAEAWQVTQNRLVVDRFTSTEALLDGSALFANRADTGTGTNPATNNNARTSGGDPSDSEWAAMENLYADIGGVATGRRVRGTLNTCYCPTGTSFQSARRHFAPLGQGGLESKDAATTTNVGLYRGQIGLVPESELRIASTSTWYALRNPTRLNTATVVRAYFNGFGTAGRRERWYDPTNKTTWVSLEGRLAVAVKNWRYAVRNVT